jgi:hypothetical protein
VNRPLRKKTPRENTWEIPVLRIGYVAKPHAVGGSRRREAGGGRAGGRPMAWRLDVVGDVARIKLRWQFPLLSC